RPPPPSLFPYTTLFRSATLQLLYWNGTVWAPVLSSGGIAPNNDTADYHFSVTFDSTSTPSITALTGTPFGAASLDMSPPKTTPRSEEHTSELQSRFDLV